MAEQNSFIFHLDSMEVLSDLTPEEVGTLVLAMVEYKKTGAEPDLQDRAMRTAWRHLSRRMREDAEAYLERCATNRKNGNLGGRPRKAETEENRSKTENNRSVFEKTEGNRSEPKKPDPDPDPDPDPYMSKDLKVIEDRKVDEGAPTPSSSIPTLYLQLSTGEMYPVTGERIEELQKAFPDIEVLPELVIMAETMRTNPAKRRTAARIEATIVNWMQIARERALERQKNAEAKAEAGAKPKKNAFGNFAQHDYNFDEIDRALDLA